MELENVKKLINHLFEIDEKFLNLDNDSIIDKDLEILSKFMEERYNTIQSINSILQNGTKLNKDYVDEVSLKINEHTKLLTSKTLTIQSLVKDRILKTNNFKSAHQYFHNTQSNPIFLDKTI